MKSKKRGGPEFRMKWTSPEVEEGNAFIWILGMFRQNFWTGYIIPPALSQKHASKHARTYFMCGIQNILSNLIQNN